MSEDDPPKISREEAKAMIDDHQWGTLIVVDEDPIPVIGSVPDEDREYRSEMSTFVFGSMGPNDE